METTGVDSLANYKRCQGGERESGRKRQENKIKAERGEKKGGTKERQEGRKQRAREIKAAAEDG